MKVTNFARAVWILGGSWLIWVGWAIYPGTDVRVTKGIIIIGIAELVAAVVPWQKAEGESSLSKPGNLTTIGHHGDDT
jgi:hypothetical protein